MTAVGHGLDRRLIGLVLAGAFSVFAATVAVVSTAASVADDAVTGLVQAYGSVMYAFVGIVVLWRRPGHGIGRLAPPYWWRRSRP